MSIATTQQVVASKQTETELIRVLQGSLYPGAALPSVQMVLAYCEAAGLDPMQKPVHIVPMWSQKEGRMIDVIMPGINLYRIQAARSGQFAGMSEPEYGSDINVSLSGVDITVPEWCRVTVKRALSNGIVAEFTSREYWIENYAVKGGKEKSVAPNAMWQKRPRGQIAKCASAQAMRIAFPEIASALTADEMEGKSVMQELDITPSPQSQKILPAIADDRLEKAVLAIKNGDYTVEKLCSAFALTADQLRRVGDALAAVEMDQSGVTDD